MALARLTNSFPLVSLPLLLVFPLAVSLFQASGPPRLRLIGLDVGVPVFSWHKRGEHGKAQCVNNDARCGARYTSRENIFITHRCDGEKKKRGKKYPVDLEA